MSAHKLEWQALWDAMDANPSAWIETTEAMYWDMLEVLPPRKMLGNNFMVGEPLRHNGQGEAATAAQLRAAALELIQTLEGMAVHPSHYAKLKGLL